MKRTLTGIAAAAMVLGTVAPAAFAATTSGLTKAGQLPIVVNGTVTSNPFEMTGIDSGNTTGFFPVYYFNQALAQLGFTATWDGTTHTWAITAPGVTPTAVDGGVGTGNTTVTVNGTVVKKFNTQAAKDPAAGPSAQETTYLPVFYINNILTALGVQGSFSGQTGLAISNVAGQATGIKLAATSPIVANGAATETLTANVVDANGRTVTNFNGTVNVAITNNGAAYLTTDDATKAGGTGLYLAGVAVKNGVAKFDVLAGTGAGLSDTITLSGLTPNSDSTVGSNVTYTGGSISSVAPAATSLKLSIPSNKPTTLSANTVNGTQFTVSVKDQSGVTYVTGGSYVTLTLSGQGSFSSTSVVTSKTLWVSGTSTAIDVYSLAGQAGNISVTATANGLTSGTLSVPTYINTAPASVSVTSEAGNDATTGAAYTLYTVKLLDTLGHPISTAADTLNITDDAADQGGAIKYGTIDAYGNFQNGVAPTQLVNGIATFAVETTTVGAAPATITVKDTTNSFSATAPYSFTAENPVGVDVSPASTITNYKVKAGQTVTFKAQLVDTNDNNVSLAGHKVLFRFNGANVPGAVFPNGDNAGTYAATTDANGVASVVVTVPSSAGAGTFTVQAEDSSLTGASFVSGATVNVVTGSTYATSLSLSSTPTTIQNAGSPIAAVTAQPKNAVGDNVTTDTLQVTTSDSSVVALGSPDVAGGSTQTFGAGVTSITGLTAKKAGTATITVTDISNPDKPSKSFSVSVQPATFVANVVQYNGKTVSSGNPLSVTANTPVQLTVVHADGGGNPVPATSNDWVALNDGGKGGFFTLTQGGAPVTEVQIPQGQSSVAVYYVNAATTSVTSFGAADNQPAPANATLSSLTAGASTATAGTDVTYTLVLKDASGNAVSGQAGNISVTGIGGTVSLSSAVAETATPGTYTFKVNDTKAETLAIGATYNGTTLTAGNVTVNPAAVSQYVFNPTSLSGSSVVVTAEDQYNNAVKNATIYLAFTSTAATTPATASVGGTALTSTAASFTADANGQVTVTYTAGTGTTGNTDTLTATNAASSATVTGTATHTY